MKTPQKELQLTQQQLKHDEAVREITVLNTEIMKDSRNKRFKAIRIGELLAGIEAELKPGAFLPWIKANLPFAITTGQNYMRVFNRWEEVRSETIAAERKAKGFIAETGTIAERKARRFFSGTGAEAYPFDEMLNSLGPTVVLLKTVADDPEVLSDLSVEQVDYVHQACDEIIRLAGEMRER
jgi:hypothetical protein